MEAIHRHAEVDSAEDPPVAATADRIERAVAGLAAAGAALPGRDCGGGAMRARTAGRRTRTLPGPGPRRNVGRASRPVGTPHWLVGMGLIHPSTRCTR